MTTQAYHEADMNIERLIVDGNDDLRLETTDDAGNTDSRLLGPIDGPGVWRLVPADLFDRFEELLDEYDQDCRAAEAYAAQVVGDYYAGLGCPGGWR